MRVALVIGILAVLGVAAFLLLRPKPKDPLQKLLDQAESNVKKVGGYVSGAAGHVAKGFADSPFGTAAGYVNDGIDAINPTNWW